MRSSKSKKILASSIIAKYFNEERKKAKIPKLTKEEREKTKEIMKEFKETQGENIYKNKSTDELLELKNRLLDTKEIILADIDNGKDSKNSFRLAITNTYLNIVEKELKERKE